MKIWIDADYCQLDSQECISVKFQSKYNIYYQENAPEHVVYKIAAILFGPSWVNVDEWPASQIYEAIWVDCLCCWLVRKA